MTEPSLGLCATNFSESEIHFKKRDFYMQILNRYVEHLKSIQGYMPAVSPCNKGRCDVRRARSPNPRVGAHHSASHGGARSPCGLLRRGDPPGPVVSMLEDTQGHFTLGHGNLLLCCGSSKGDDKTCALSGILISFKHFTSACRLLSGVQAGVTAPERTRCACRREDQRRTGHGERGQSPSCFCPSPSRFP